MLVRTTAKILTKLYKNTPAVANNGKLYVCKTTGNGRAAEDGVRGGGRERPFECFNGVRQAAEKED